MPSASSPGRTCRSRRPLQINPANIVLTFSFTTEVHASTRWRCCRPPRRADAEAEPDGHHDPAGGSRRSPGHANIYVGTLSIPYYSPRARRSPASGTRRPSRWIRPAPSSRATTRCPWPRRPCRSRCSRPSPTRTPRSGGRVHPRPGGWPVLIFQHGITRSREDCLRGCGLLRRRGIRRGRHRPAPARHHQYQRSALRQRREPAVCGLDLPATGSIERTFDLDVQTTPPCTGRAIDPSGSHFINLTSLLTSRDNVREGAADLITFTRTLATASFGAAGTVNAAAIHFLGHSLGAIMGGTFLGVMPSTEIGTATLANPGGGIAQLLLDSPAFAPADQRRPGSAGTHPGHHALRAVLPRCTDRGGLRRPDQLHRDSPAPPIRSTCCRWSAAARSPAAPTPCPTRWCRTRRRSVSSSPRSYGADAPHAHSGTGNAGRRRRWHRHTAGIPRLPQLRGRQSRLDHRPDGVPGGDPGDADRGDQLHRRADSAGRRAGQHRRARCS